MSAYRIIVSWNFFLDASSACPPGNPGYISQKNAISPRLLRLSTASDRWTQLTSRNIPVNQSLVSLGTL